MLTETTGGQAQQGVEMSRAKSPHTHPFPPPATEENGNSGNPEHMRFTVYEKD